jgi:hypothetical protein
VTLEAWECAWIHWLKILECTRLVWNLRRARKHKRLKLPRRMTLRYQFTCGIKEFFLIGTKEQIKKT